MAKITKGDLKAELGSKVQVSNARPSSGGSGFMLGVARVVTVNYEEFTVTLRVVIGADSEFQRVPVPITFPGAGSRHILASMPEVGDHCVVGHLAQETDGRTSTPVILGWILSGTWTGHDWIVTQPFSPDEYSMDPKDSTFVEGAYERVRHKLRHMEPGHILASSSQGADLVLNEGVLLANRRGNEIQLRDQDQAIIARSLQQFHAMAGSRIYAGMVQRTGSLLPTQMFSDGTLWETPLQVDPDTKEALTDTDLYDEKDPHAYGKLTPNPLFDRLKDDGTYHDVNLSGVLFEPNLDPYDFLTQGLFITDQGSLYDTRVLSDAVYGGKPLYRVSVNTDEDGLPLNSCLGTGDQTRSLTEYRLEVSHTSDGRLPVTEETDGFDAERLPRTAPGETDTGARSSSAPFIEQVYGSVVGNDPFSSVGRDQYGLPLMARIFEADGTPNPDMVSAVGEPLGEHAATLFRLFPVTPSLDPPTFWSVTKDGRVRASIQGPKVQEFSAEVALTSGLRVRSGGVISLEAEKGVKFDISQGSTADNSGLDLACSKGSVRIYGGGETQRGGAGRRSAPTGGEDEAPSLLLEGRKNLELKANKRIFASAGLLEARVQNCDLRAQAGVSVQAGDSISMSSKTYDLAVMGRATQTFHGPKDLLPTYGSHRDTKFTGIGTGVVDEYFVLLGNRQETFLVGNHATSILVGNLTYETVAGVVTHRAGFNQVSVDVATGISGTVAAGNISFSAPGGNFMALGGIASMIKSFGVTTISGASGVFLGGPGKVGGIVCASDLDPLTGLPLVTFGMGSPGHVLGAPV